MIVFTLLFLPQHCRMGYIGEIASNHALQSRPKVLVEMISAFRQLRM